MSGNFTLKDVEAIKKKVRDECEYKAYKENYSLRLNCDRTYQSYRDKIKELKEKINTLEVGIRARSILLGLSVTANIVWITVTII